jgi:hypothetical protein
MAQRRLRHDAAAMMKRTASALAWFAAVWVAYEIVWSLTDAPRLVGPIAAFVVAAFVVLDPAHLFWPRTDTVADRSRVMAGASGARS